ncbi:hypothetical protein FQZ97_827450 [compost metagenome]
MSLCLMLRPKGLIVYVEKSANDSAASTSTNSLIWYREFAVTYIDEKFFSKYCINFS